MHKVNNIWISLLFSFSSTFYFVMQKFSAILQFLQRYRIENGKTKKHQLKE